MKPAYAKPFMDAYRKSVGKKLANGRRQMEKHMGSDDPVLSLAAFANLGQELDNSLVAQAYEAYMSDLRRGRLVGTPVEKAIWAILYNRSDLIEAIDRPFQKYINEKCDEKFPRLLDEAFGGGSSESAAPKDSTPVSEPRNHIVTCSVTAVKNGICMAVARAEDGEILAVVNSINPEMALQSLGVNSPEAHIHEVYKARFRTHYELRVDRSR